MLVQRLINNSKYIEDYKKTNIEKQYLIHRIQ